MARVMVILPSPVARAAWLPRANDGAHDMVNYWQRSFRLQHEGGYLV